ncbi:DHH family phosphoesterase [bacterium]|nr:DHH family phosphoesterase [bacterium]
MASSLPTDIARLREGGPTTWVVASHMNPDCDTLGSAIAMKRLLRAFGHRVIHLCPDPVPDAYRFLPGADEVVTELPADLPADAGLVTLDAADMGRFGRLRERLEAFSLIVDVDHHVSNPRFGHVNVVLEDAAATGEVVYRLFKHFAIPIDPEAAVGMYVALVTDTGGFAYEATNAESHEMAAALIRAGVQPGVISRALYEHVPLAELKIKAMGLASATLAAAGRVAYTTITRAMLDEVGAKEEHTEGLSESLRALAGVEVSFFLRETASGALKASMRSKAAVDVSRLAAKFGGGGHRRAAGCTFDMPMDQAVQTLLEAIDLELQAPR